MTMPNIAMVEGCVVIHKEVGPGQYLLSLKAPLTFPTPDPGQFLMLKALPCPTPLLARPFSIYAFSRKDDHAVVDILYQITGLGTRLMSRLAPGSSVRIMGPLGKGFSIIPERKNVVLIAGGMGLAPLTFLADHYVTMMRRMAGTNRRLQRRVMVYAGAGTASALAGIERIEALCEEVKVSTDDGSAGFRGTVTELFKRDVAFFNPDDTAIYACGPAAMLKTLAAILQGVDVFCQVSTEERMACGLGACLGCVIPLKEGNGEIGYRRVCTEGPVFPIKDIIWAE